MFGDQKVAMVLEIHKLEVSFGCRTYLEYASLVKRIGNVHLKLCNQVIVFLILKYLLYSFLLHPYL